MKGLIQVIVKLGLKKIFDVFFIHQSVSLRRGAQNIAMGYPSCVAILCKGTNWKFTFLWRKMNWHGLQIAKRHFSYTIWLMISGKSIMAYMFLDHGDAPRCSYKKIFLLEFPIPWTYIYLQKEGIAKHFGKKNIQLVWTVVTYLMLNMELKMKWIVVMEFLCIRNCWSLQQINLIVC